MLGHLLAALVEDLKLAVVTKRNIQVPPGGSVAVDDMVDVLLTGIVVHVKMVALDPDLRLDIESPRATASINLWSLVDAGLVQPGPVGAYVTKFDPDELECAAVVHPPVPMFLDSARVSLYSKTGATVVNYIRSGYSVSLASVRDLVKALAAITVIEREEVERITERIIERPPTAKEEKIPWKARVRLDPEARRQ